MCDSHLRSNAPGPDHATTAALRALWPGALERLLPPLYSYCLRAGWFPTPWKTCNVVEIPKPGKPAKALHSPKGWRPIALLATVSKGLERVAAGRLEQAARQAGILPTQLAGPVKGRSATDLLAALLHDVDVARVACKKAALLKLDVAQAFPSVRPRRMAHRLLALGLGARPALFAERFMTGRTACLVLDGKPRPQAGLPQGSPLSPVLLALYMATAPAGPGVFNYVDDFAVLGVGRTHETAKAAVEHAWAALDEWAGKEGLAFDPGKTEFLAVGKKAGETAARLREVEVASSESVEVLGLTVDRKLSFRPHAQKVAAKASRCANLLKRVSHCYKGLPPKAAVVATAAVVEAQVHYAIEAWWPGPTRTRLGRTHGTGAVKTAEVLDRPVNVALRAAIAAWRTTPTATVRRTAGRPPTLVVAASKRARYLSRLRRSAPDHPAKARLQGGGDSRLTRKPEGPTAQQWYSANSSLSCDQQLQRFQAHPAELGLRRRTLHKLVADRSGHGRFASYFKRFKPDDTSLAEEAVCACGRPLEPNHPERCAALRGKLTRPSLWGHGKKWATEVEDFYDQQDCILENY